VANGQIRSFVGLLWRQFNYQFLLVIAAFSSSMIESASAASWSFWRLLPPVLLGICLLYFLIRTALVHKSIYPNPVLAYSVCTGKSQEWFENSAQRQQHARLEQSGIRWDAVQSEFRIHVTDWAFVDQSVLTVAPDTWVNLTRRMLTHFWHYPVRVDRVPVYHFFLIAPPTVCFALGAHAGRRVPHVVYHFVNNTKHPYTPVADTTTRDTSKGLDLRNRRIAPSEYSHIVVQQVAKSEFGNRVRIILDFRNSMLSAPFPDDSQTHEILKVQHKDGIGHLPSENWERMAQEIASLVLDRCDHGQEIDLYINTPLAMAFIIGSIVGPVRNLMLCEHNDFLQKNIRCFELADSRIQSLSSSVAP